MSGSPGLTLALAAVVILIAGASYRRRADGDAPHRPVLAWILGGLALIGAIIIFFLYRRP
ncbi:MAG TPA: hypothetical protein VGF77_17570 [Allosphingosinicella sp.]